MPNAAPAARPPLEIRYRKLSELVPYAKNARTHGEAQVAQIAASVREWGFTNPVLIDEEGGIIAGHGRVLAAMRLSLVEVPTITLRGLTPTQKRAYVLADNKLALNAGWDAEMLALELNDLIDGGFDMALTGFAHEEIEELLAGAMEGGTGIGGGEGPPDSFNEYDESIKTNQTCPKCGYEWSDGKGK